MKLSIIIPVYNVEKYIKNTIESIVNQAYDDYELILVNDGSTDHSAEICRQMANKNSKIKIIDITNSGSGIARNVGIDNANGEYCYFPDADDLMTDNSLQRIDEITSKCKADLYVFGYFVVKRDGNVEIKKNRIDEYMNGNDIKEHYEEYMQEGDKYIQGAPWNKVFKTGIIKEYNIRYPDLRRNQDEIFILRYMDKANSVKFSNESIYKYYMNSLQDEWNKFPKNYFDIRTKVFNEFKDTIENWNKSNLNTRTIINYGYISQVLRCMEFSFNPKWDLNAKQRKEYIKNIVEDENVKEAISFIIQNKKYVRKYITKGDNTRLKVIIIFYQIGLVNKKKTGLLYFMSKTLIHIRKLYKEIKYGIKK